MSKSPVVCDHPAVAHFCPQDGMEVRPDSPPPFPVKAERAGHGKTGPPTPVIGPQRLPNELLDRVVQYISSDDKARLFNIARLSSAAYNLVKPGLYHSITLDPMCPSSIPLGLIKHDASADEPRLGMIKHLRIRPHSIGSCWWQADGTFLADRDISHHRTVETLRVDLDPSCEHRHPHKVTTADWRVIPACCPLLKRFDTRKLVLFGTSEEALVPLEQKTPESCETVVSVILPDGYPKHNGARMNMSLRLGPNVKSCVFVFWTEDRSTLWKRPRDPDSYSSSDGFLPTGSHWLRWCLIGIIYWAASTGRPMELTFVGLERTTMAVYIDGFVPSQLHCAWTSARRHWAMFRGQDEWVDTILPPILRRPRCEETGQIDEDRLPDAIKLVTMEEYLKDKQGWAGVFTEEEVERHLASAGVAEPQTA